MTEQEIQTAVTHRITELLLIVRSRTDAFGNPAVEYYDNKLAAGYAHYKPHKVSFNMPMFRDNFDSMLHETVAHELAHLVVRHCWLLDGGRRPKPHGREWQDVMRNWFNVEPTTTHDYDTSTTNARRQNRWEARCSCRVHKITTAKKMKMLVDKRRYICTGCETHLELTGRQA